MPSPWIASNASFASVVSMHLQNHTTQIRICKIHTKCKISGHPHVATIPPKLTKTSSNACHGDGYDDNAINFIAWPHSTPSEMMQKLLQTKFSYPQVTISEIKSNFFRFLGVFVGSI